MYYVMTKCFISIRVYFLSCYKMKLYCEKNYIFYVIVRIFALLRHVNVSRYNKKLLLLQQYAVCFVITSKKLLYR